MRALYISHNGMLEGLGHGQVLPYLRGLARRGVEIDLLSFEAAGTTPEAVEALRDSLRASGIRWSALPRRRDTRLRVKILESSRGALEALVTALRRRPDIVHGRSYLPTAIADVVASMVPGARLVFDCRGMVGDEYVDARHWTQDRLEYKLVKRYEARAFHRAEGVVVLTEALKRWIGARRWFGPATRVEAIPCCVDLEAVRFDEAARARLRAELGVEGKVVIVYAGSLGSWYREADLARFASIVKKKAGRPVAFVVLTRAEPGELVGLLRGAGLAPEEIVVRAVRPSDMPAYLSVGDIGLSFIMSCFSKMGSSPTKVAEYLACGLPVVLNGDIGDQSDLAAEPDACVVLRSFSDDDLAVAADAALALAARPIAERVRAGRRVAELRFGLERVGVARYERLYRALVDAT